MNSKPIYLDPFQPVDARVSDLLGRMTLEEKFREMGMGKTRNMGESGRFSKKLADEFFKGMGIGAMQDARLDPVNNAAFINDLQKYLIENTRLGIPALIISECLHGFLSPGATMFPQSIALGSSWNDALVGNIAAAAAKEATACGTRQALAPNLDLAREPRWGRVEETYGEDPYLCGCMGVEYVRGMQGERGVLAEDKLVVTLKHFAAHGSPEGGLFVSPVPTGERQLRELYLQPFKIAVMKAGALSVMPAYSEIDGIPCSTSKFLLIKILREEWGFKGYVFSDYVAIEMLQSSQRTAETPGHAGKQALEAGMDLEAPHIYGFGEELLTMVKEGKVDEKHVNRAVSNVLRVKFLCALFERPYIDIKKVSQTVHCEKHKELALKAAHESIILLKNKGNLLPLRNMAGSIAVIGPNADKAQLGDYSIRKESDVSLLQGIKNRSSKGTEVYYTKGCELYGSSLEGFPEAIDMARKAEVAIVAVGTSSGMLSGIGWGDKKGEIATCGEGFDWTDLKLPGVQEQLIEEIAKTGTPTIVVLINGRPLTFDYIAENIPAIIEAWYPGEEGGNALADIIFGNVNPSGRLTITFPKVSGQSPMYYNHKPSARGSYNQPGTPEKPGMDYVFNDTKPLYGFGYGLSYTEFEYSDLKVSSDVITPHEKVTVSVKVKNTGACEGKEVVQLYLNDVYSSVTTPVKALKGYKKISLDPGEEQKVSFVLTPEEMSLIDENMKEVVEPGLFEVMIDDLRTEFRVK